MRKGVTCAQPQWLLHGAYKGARIWLVFLFDHVAVQTIEWKVKEPQCRVTNQGENIMTERIPVIVGAVRTPTGKFLSHLASFTAPQLGAIAIKEAVRRSGVAPEAIDEVIMGNVVSAGVGQAPARQAALHSGLPVDIPAFTINKVCGSGLKAVMLAAQAIRAGDAQVFVAGGMESMSNAPYILPKARTGYRMGDGKIVDSVVHDGLWCAFEDIHMGNEAEIIAEKFGVTREEQDRFSLQSHQKAAAATAAGRFKEEIIPIEIKQKKGTLIIDSDEPIRGDSSMDTLTKLMPAFQEGGTVTAGNAPGLSDGASATVVVDQEFAQAQNLTHPGSHSRLCYGCHYATLYLRRTTACRSPSPRAYRPQDERLRPDRGQRSLCRPGSRQWT